MGYIEAVVADRSLREGIKYMEAVMTMDSHLTEFGGVRVRFPLRQQIKV